MTYEDYGYMCADSMLSTLVEQPCQSAPQPVFNDKEGSIWKQPLTAITAGIHLDSEGVARQHAILCLAFRQFCHIGLVSDDDGRRILQGMMNRFDERFSDFSSDPLTADAAADYLRAAATDIKNKSKTESFPTLVPLAIERITGLKPSDPRWAAVSDSLYSLLEVILKTAEPMLIGTKKNVKLV